MKTPIQLCSLLVSALIVGGCTANVATPWDRSSLDPGRIATLEPLEIPPDFDTLPEPGLKKEGDETQGPDWVTSAEEGAETGAIPTLFREPASANEDGSISRNEKEQLPGWIGSDIQSQ
ncbi:MAG: hypothetical protein HQL72_03830 [Magnetococcales bacterium]|nr:hypothetical protein [Magnetococcales bacterium]